VDEEIHRPPLVLEDTEGLVHGGVAGHVAFDQRGDADLGGERLDALLERFALIGEGDFGALVGESLGDTPSNGVLVGDAHDEPALASHKSCHSSCSFAAWGGPGFGIAARWRQVSLW